MIRTCKHHDPFAVSMCKGTAVVGHVPRRIPVHCMVAGCYGNNILEDDTDCTCSSSMISTMSSNTQCEFTQYNKIIHELKVL